MADIGKQLIGVVIRADGTVPFDEIPADTPEEHRGRIERDRAHVRAEIMAYLIDQGHTVEPIEGTKHVRIRNWKPPHKKGT